jgi:predicted Zn-dependent peptidase
LLVEAAKLQPAGLQANAPNADTAATAASPSAYLEVQLQRILGLEPSMWAGNRGTGQYVEAVVIAGKLEDDQLEAVQQRLSELSPPPARTDPQTREGVSPVEDLHADWDTQLAQAQLGYAVAAPGPAAGDYLAWRALQYILAHDYEGRLGKEAISNRGLAYYLDSQYRSNGQDSWSSITVGVDPLKLDELQALFREQLQLLQQQPPSEAEVAEARNHLAGRLLTARQSNAELSAGLAEQWLWYGRLPGQEEQLQQIGAITREQVQALVPRFTRGAFAVVKAGKVPVIVTD